MHYVNEINLVPKMGQIIKVQQPVSLASINGLYVILEATFTIALLGVLLYNLPCFLNVLATFWTNFCKKIILFTILTRDLKKLGIIKNYLFWLPGKYFNHIFFYTYFWQIKHKSMFKLEFKVLEYIKVFKFWSLCIQNIVTGKIFDSKLLNQNDDLKFDVSHFKDLKRIKNNISVKYCWL